MTITRRTFVGGAVAAPALLGTGALGSTPDKVRVGVFPVSASLPFFVAQARGYFAEAGIEVVPTQMASSTLILGAFLTNDLDAAAALVMLEALNINLKSPGRVAYISVNGQNADHVQESVMVRNGLEAKSIADLKGKATKIMAASGPANTSIARAVFRANGLRDGQDYLLTDLALNLHIGAMTAGTFDAGYTLEPGGTILKTRGGARVLEQGVVSTYVLGDPKALTFGAGGALNSTFVQRQPEVAKRYAAAWRKALRDIEMDLSARDALKVNTQTPPELVREVGIPSMRMVSDMTSDDRSNLQKFADFATDQSILSARIDTGTALHAL